MRDAFTRALQRLAAEDKNLLLVTGDLGFGVLKPFWETIPISLSTRASPNRQ